MLDRIVRWVDERIPLTSVIRLGLDEEIPGGARFAYTLGSATLVVFVIQMITGVWQLLYYVPTVDHAYDSLNYLRTEVPFGWLIHGLHYWGGNAIIVLVGLHIARVFVYGAYKSPRELTWLAGVVLLLVTAGLVFTGAPLPWDERGYWAAEVGTSIAGTVPLVGDAVKRLLRGGDLMGQLALSRMFVLHVAILPAILLAFLAVHLAAFRRFGSVGPWDESKRQRSGPFWPDQVLKDGVVATFLLVFLIALCTYASPPFAGPADPLDTSYVPKPEWNFLFLYETLKFFPGRLEPLGTVGIPLIGILILLMLPFADRGPERNPLRRPVAMAGGVIWVGAVVILTIIGYRSHPAGPEAGSRAPGGSHARLSQSAREGATLVGSLGCTGCHRINGSGGSVGPDLSNVSRQGRSREWLIAQIRDPKSHDQNSIMPSYPTLTQQQLDQIVDYLQSLGAADPPGEGKATGSPPVREAPDPAAPSRQSPVSPPAATSPSSKSSGAIHGLGPLPAGSSLGPPGRAASVIGSVEHGAVLFRLYCASCHGPEGKGGIPNPGSTGGAIPPLSPIDRKFYSSDPQTFANNIDRVLQYGSIPKGPMPEKRMLEFGMTNSLTQEEIADLEAYLLERNDVDRAQVLHPGIPPKIFFYLTMAALVLAAGVLGGVWARMRAKAGRNAS
jgi:quinol-cytochrome oxidoreductase complex cytochrome b subunit/mono/diheme cytochrome c family protein